ncbi:MULTISPECIES: nickel transporter permease [unclassified Candidatus Frackibacter]|uniref:nickel transporter permease n=1 Tax=unclassified Candidatus Frackibacter TaxID=2648818 RepID=UPI000891699A|nr:MULTISPECIES: nickel transporter permease [unclassified Candidatus Frackibacter]SDC88177.1 peptide/nickel transport system permease protein [Candidatus Frackibacter sp. WG11]SEN02093.1 peptide/nickel transport system permease protein [Candidatus Frackibacter sp. WG12]SFM10828.1 peptide/nickel transport system permease protein [Candidatus Frackibacter sp. WG13]
MTSSNIEAPKQGTDLDVPAQEGESSSLWKEVGKRLLKNKTAVFGLGIIVTLIIVAILAPLLAPYRPTETDIISRLKAPSANHWLGTDELGRDILSRLIYGSRISLQVGVISVSIALVFGAILGLIAGYYGGYLDNLIMRIIDIMLAFPSILLAIAIMSILGPQLKNAMIAIGIVNLPRFARIVKSSVLTVKEEEYVEAAKALGANDSRILFKHLLPNCMAPIIVQATLSIATAILEAAGLSFLGLGAQPPTPEWGAMLSAGRTAIQVAPWVVAFPGLAIIITVLGFNLFGDGLRDALDPKMKDN